MRPRAHRRPRRATGGDHDKGHGNDADGVDEDNPGHAKQGKKAKHKGKKKGAAEGDDDHDKGHGNDADGVDEGNPGRSKQDG